MVARSESSWGLCGIMKTVAIAEWSWITVILACNLCCWPRNYPTTITWHHSQLPPLIESNQDCSLFTLRVHVEPLPVSTGRGGQARLQTDGQFLFCQSEQQKGSICVWIVSSNNLEDFPCQVETLKPSSYWWEKLPGQILIIIKRNQIISWTEKTVVCSVGPPCVCLLFQLSD